MSCYFGFRTKKPIGEQSLAELGDFLPLAGACATRYFSADNTSGLIRFDWSDFTFDYEGTFGLPDRSLTDAENIHSLRNALGGFAYISPNGPVFAYRSWSTEHPVYYREYNSGLYVSNRIALLLSLCPACVDRQAALDLIGHGYLLGEETLFEGINRLRPGAAITSSGTVDNPDLSSLFAPITPDEAINEIQGFVSRKADLFASIRQPLILPLSGGKDSRAIASILDGAGLLTSASTVYTRGNLYSPDVLAAKEVAATLGISHHQIRTPPHLPSDINFPLSTVSVAQATEGTLSLFDRGSIGSAATISIDGHELNLKKSYFEGAPACGFDRITAFFQKKKPMDPSGVLTEHGRAKANDRYRSILQQMVRFGVPEHKLPEAFMWQARGHGWVGTMAGLTNIGKTTINPLMDIDLISLGLRLPAEYRDAHFLSFALMATATKKTVWDIPFSNDQWPEGLPVLLQRIGWSGPMPKRTQPHISHRSFPSGANPFLSNAAIESTRALRKYTIQRINDDILGSQLDLTAIRSRLDEGAGVSLGRMLTELSLAVIALITEYGRDLFKLKNRQIIAESLAPYFDSASRTTDVASRLQTLLDLHEKSIAELMIEMRRIQSTAQKPTTNSPHWRYIDIRNDTETQICYQLVLNDTLHAPRSIAPKSTYTYGITTAGNCKILVGGNVVKAFEISDGMDTYDVLLG